MGRIEAPYNDVTETDKKRYCSVIIEMMEFLVKRIENLPPEISLPEMKYKTWDSTMQSLRRENANLKEQVEEERKRNKKLRKSVTNIEQSSSITDELKSEINRLERELEKEKSKSKKSFTPFGKHKNMTKVNSPRELLQAVDGSDVTDVPTKLNEREVELESENGRLKNQIQELKHFTQNLEIERKVLLERLSEISTNKRAPADKTENGSDLDPQMSSSVATRFSDLFIKDWATAYKVLSSVVKNDRKVTYLLLQCLMNAFNICNTKANEQRRRLHEENLTEGLLDPDLVQDTPRQIIEMQINEAPETLPEITRICRDRISRLSSYPPEVTHYVDSCVEICWFMVIQSPPFYLSCIAPPGEMVDTSKYTFYRTSGRYVDFVVWPILFDREGGTVISKGVVQGRN
uniref:Mitochondria-eating protein n=1 Tax=Crassostrea virginica TaxID=6565 RepID=A0A8B8DHQ9_CRAVI|nr:leucine zipper protein 1-like [Crassostrea virginica]